jgi:hypothetical protein
MPYLGDYLGQLLSEISMARMQADLESVRLAELYASHPLLRTMPVPHVRLPDVELDIPVLVQTSEEPRTGETSRGGLKIADMSRRFDEIIETHLTKTGVSLTLPERRKLRAAIDERLTPTSVPEISVDVHKLAGELTTTALRVIDELKPKPAVPEPGTPPLSRGRRLKDTGESEAAPQSARELEDTVRREFLKLRTTPPRLSVLVTSAQLKETGTPDNMMRLRLKITEQGLEWTSIEEDGGRRDLLIPE